MRGSHGATCPGFSLLSPRNPKSQIEINTGRFVYLWHQSRHKTGTASHHLEDTPGTCVWITARCHMSEKCFTPPRECCRHWSAPTSSLLKWDLRRTAQQFNSRRAERRGLSPGLPSEDVNINTALERRDSNCSSFHRLAGKKPSPTVDAFCSVASLAAAFFLFVFNIFSRLWATAMAVQFTSGPQCLESIIA